MTALVVLNGQPDRAILDYVAEDTAIYCADGGANTLYDLNITPMVIMGDMDSIKPHVKEYYMEQGCEFVVFQQEKDETDGELIIEKAMEDGCSEIFVFCGLGGRLDHTLGNMQLLYRMVKAGVFARIISENTSIYCTLDDLTLYKDKCGIVSIIPYEEDTVLTLRGFKYDVDRLKFQKDTPIGLSNYLLQDKGNIYVHSGCPMVVVSRDIE